MSKRAHAKSLVQAKAEADPEYAQDIGCISSILQYIDELTDSELDGDLGYLGMVGNQVDGLECYWDVYIPYYLESAWATTRSEEGMQLAVFALWQASIHIQNGKGFTFTALPCYVRYP